MDREPIFEAGRQSPDLPKLCRYLSERSPLPMVAVHGSTHIVSYLNPAFARLVGRDRSELIGFSFADAVPEGEANGCIDLLDRVFHTGTHECLIEQEHRQSHPRTVYWSYAVWAILGEVEQPTGVMIQVTDATEIAHFRRQSMGMNEELLLSTIRQHELVEAAESLNAKLREAHDQLEERVVERTAELAAANDTLRNEIRIRETAESDRRDLLRRLGTAQEEERRRISRDLHDQMGQLVTALGLGLKALEDSTVDPSPYRPHLVRLRELNDQIGRESHKLAMELRPTALDDLGLQAALANYVEAWSEQSSIEIDFHSTGFDGQRLDSLIETSLYRVVTEALTNVLKHGKAHRVSVILQRTPNQAIALVEDDGIGFDSESLKFSDAHLGRLGLRGMQERLTLIGGTLTIESTPGNGTTIIARVSLSNG